MDVNLFSEMFEICRKIIVFIVIAFLWVVYIMFECLILCDKRASFQVTEWVA